MLKSLEAKGYVERHRSTEDERVLLVNITPEGEALREKAVDIPVEMGKCSSLSPEEAAELYRLLYKLLESEQ